MPRKQRHTAKRVFDRLRDECGFLSRRRGALNPGYCFEDFLEGVDGEIDLLMGGRQPVV